MQAAPGQGLNMLPQMMMLQMQQSMVTAEAEWKDRQAKSDLMDHLLMWQHQQKHKGGGLGSRLAEQLVSKQFTGQ